MGCTNKEKKEKNKKRHRRTLLTPEPFLGDIAVTEKGFGLIRDRAVYRKIYDTYAILLYNIPRSVRCTIYYETRVTVYYGVQPLLKYEFVFTSSPQQVVRGYNNI